MTRPLLGAPFGADRALARYVALTTQSAGKAGHGATLALIVPAPLTVTLAVTVQNAQQRVAVAATASFTPAYWTMTRTYAGIVETVRGDDPDDWTRFVAFGPSRTLFDVEAPRGIDLTYVVTAVAADGTAVISQVFGPVQLDGTGCDWWVHPLTTPADSLTFDAEEQSSQTYQVSNGIFRLIGRRDPVVLFGPRHTPAGTLGARAADYTGAELLRATFGHEGVLVLRAPVGHGWGSFGRRYVALDVLGERPLVPTEPAQPYTVDLPWLEVVAPNVPVGVFSATWQDVIDNFATWQDVVNAFPTWDALLAWSP